jgi:hypothetical protein
MRIAHFESDLFKPSDEGCGRDVVKLGTRCRGDETGQSGGMSFAHIFRDETGVGQVDYVPVAA